MAKKGERSERRLKNLMRAQLVKRVLGRWVLGAAVAVLPLVSHALGLGRLEVKSALNQPLNAEIDITSIAESELKGLNASLAPRADFEAAGAERIPLLSQIKFTVQRRPDGRYYLQLRTDAPIEEPFLHMLLQLEWPGGRLVREYTALIDPPSYVAGKPATVESPQAEAPAAPPATPTTEFVQTVPPPAPGTDQSQARAAAPAAPIPEPLAARPQEPQPVATPAPEQPKEITVAASPEPAAEEERLADAPSQAPAAQPGVDWANIVEYTVRPGDTLWSIAERVRADKQLTLEQVMLAIFRNNPEAFFRDNVNNLRAGKVLTIPERDDVEATPRREARREFRAQYDAWQEYKLKLAAGSRTLKVAESAAEPTSPSAGSEPKPEAESTAPATPSTAKQPEELLKIVRTAPDADKAATGDKTAETETAKASETRERTALEERVTTLEESLQSKELENRDLVEKVGQVRSQIKNEKRLIELENQALAQQTAKVTEGKFEAKPEAPAPAPKTEPAPAAQANKQATPAAPAKPVRAAPKRPVPVPAPAPEEKGFIASLLDDFLDDSMLPLIGGIVVLAGGVILMLYMRRRRRSIAEFEESILASDAIATDVTPSTGDTTGQATTGDTSFLSDFSKGGMGQVHTDEVDPVAEAEVYLAYGRDETAEEILKEAVVKNPDRHELKQKLLEIYHQRNDVNAFETLAEELYAAIGGRGGTIWKKVEEMGRKLNPENPMFRGGAPAMGDSAATRVVDKASSIDFEFDTAPAAAAAAPMDAGLDFDLNVDELSPTRAGLGAGGNGLDSLDLGTPADNVIDFDSGKGENALAAETGPADDEIKWDLDASAPAEPALESAGTDSGAGGNGVDGNWDETATKLDLAKAYIDMGDAEGARSILDEVLAEGNEQQKKQAAELAAQIA